MKTLREQFEEEYIAVSVPADNKNGFKIKYVYCAPWYLWDIEEDKLKKKKRMLTCFSTASMLLYLFAGLQVTGANSFPAVEIAGIFALCAHVFELFGLFQFLFAKYRTSQMTYSNVNRTLSLFPLLRSICLAAASVSSVIYMIFITFELSALFAAAGYLICAGLAFYIFLEYRKIPVRSEKNETLSHIEQERLL
ncbi:MAG: hypothetical protein ACI4D7_03750 [Lachnospiraceae bacterium]